tara:strand:- start:41 stop:601 length:561 start_codon:yes stop_codon:yes gene_type:complete
MKERNIKNKILTQLIQEALDNFLYLAEDDDEDPQGEQLSWLDGQGSQEIERRRAEEDKSFYDESEMSLPWDDRVQELSNLLHGIALDVIDHYKGRPGFTREAAKSEILAAIGVPLDIFHGDETEFGEFYSINQLLDEEFQDVSENASNNASDAAGDSEEGETGAETVYDGSEGTTDMNKITEDRKK